MGYFLMVTVSVLNCRKYVTYLVNVDPYLKIENVIQDYILTKQP